MIELEAEGADLAKRMAALAINYLGKEEAKAKILCRKAAAPGNQNAE